MSVIDSPQTRLVFYVSRRSIAALSAPEQVLDKTALYKFRYEMRPASFITSSHSSSTQRSEFFRWTPQAASPAIIPSSPPNRKTRSASSWLVDLSGRESLRTRVIPHRGVGA